jgi:2-polyprenyl-6-methoxyphenol hydroxylase-like FAD-dependent oxidoreductase
VTASRSVIVAGAGIGGLTAALALSRNGFRVTVLEQTERLSETGAGIQLSPNAARCLIDLGVGERLRPHVTTPMALRVLVGYSGREIVRMPLGEAAQRYGAPYWIIHRGDLQAALVAAVTQEHDVSLKLGMRVEDFATHSHGVTVSANGPGGIWHERGHALIAADGLWSDSRARLGFKDPPRFAGRTAWRALIPASEVPAELREPLIHLWLGRDAHLVHYPVKAGAVINVVVITTDSWNAPGWSAPASRIELLPRLPAERWAPQARALVREPETWLKWALYDHRPLPNFCYGAAALIGDAAHPMLPFLAQGAAMAIEDAVVAAHRLTRIPDDAVAALQSYSALRWARTRKVQRLAARNGVRYHLSPLPAMLRNAAMHAMGGAWLLRHYDWLYDWRPPAAASSN